ncbi:Coenzyme PQQ synthesis protein D (PqqD) [Desulfonatronum thiosulfatophilum]|uniref:Coenzyme PQQ synthesis protein D (PqqD) n=1 Tax=Desulfonatronum thiosulfatophilum TaxID=617002 RepID=A0A1G6AJ29_9BACT|nr:PqqD family protein [Desulfonatronum thiosulfatophilum]SDB08340.1 Coenzyme PQQ synthesis protein D (PqqD) [Desulfonatronum thiosulfatophilum]
MGSFDAKEGTQRRSEPRTRQEALSLRPVRNKDVLEEKQPNGLIRLSYPLTLKPWFGKWAQKLGKWDGRPMTKKLELDEMGGLAWSMVNGSHTVRDIIDAFIAEYGLQPKEAELSVTAFIKELGRRGIIGLR